MRKQRVRPKTRQLQAGEPIPSVIPYRCRRKSDGYVRLRWPVSDSEIVEAYEHRVVAGMNAEHVHHINGIRDDNRPENLVCLTERQHKDEHAKVRLAALVLLYESGVSTHVIGHMVGLHYTTVLRRLQLSGIKMRTRSEARRLQNTRDLK